MPTLISGFLLHTVIHSPVQTLPIGQPHRVSPLRRAFREYHAQVALFGGSATNNSRKLPPTGPVPTVESPTVSAARAAGLDIFQPAEPQKRSVEVAGEVAGGGGPVSLSYLDWGNSHLPPLLFIHGFAQKAHSWDFACLALRHIFHCIAVDLRGHGDSGWSRDGVYRLDRYVEDIEEFIQVTRLEKPILCGLSLGGRIAWNLAAGGTRPFHPELDAGPLRPVQVRALVVAESAPEISESVRSRVSSFVDGPSVFSSFESAVEHVRRYNPRRSEESVRGSLANSVRRQSDGTWTWKFDPAIRNGGPPSASDIHWRSLSRVRCPTLFVLGAESDLVSPGVFDRMLSAVPGSRAVIVEKAGHLVAGDNPRGFQDALLPFLTGLQGATGIP